jgi:hypothetical protein
MPVTNNKNVVFCRLWDVPRETLGRSADGQVGRWAGRGDVPRETLGRSADGQVGRWAGRGDVPRETLGRSANKRFGDEIRRETVSSVDGSTTKYDVKRCPVWTVRHEWAGMDRADADRAETIYMFHVAHREEKKEKYICSTWHIERKKKRNIYVPRGTLWGIGGERHTIKHSS